VKRRIVPLALAAFAAAYLAQAMTVPLDPWSASEPVNARTLPVAAGCALLLTALALVAWPGTVPAATSPEGRGAKRSARAGVGALALHVAAIVGFGLAIPRIGLWLATAALFFASLFIAGERRPWLLVLAPLGTAFAAWLLLVVVLDIYVDPGRWMP